MAMSKVQAEDVLRDFLPRVRRLFYNGGTFEMAGMPVVARITIEPEQYVDAVPAIVGDGIGVGVTQPLLDVGNDNAIKFALAHELGHGFSERVLRNCNLQGVSGPVTEVIADLGAAYLLANSGVSWQYILDTVDDWQTSGIFTANKNGDHPPGAQRATYVHSLFSLLQSGHDFNEAAAGICLSLL
ncbi:MAG: M48 family metalloprotease [Burkholderiaceae bacterium]